MLFCEVGDIDDKPKRANIVTRKEADSHTIG